MQGWGLTAGGREARDGGARAEVVDVAYLPSIFGERVRGPRNRQDQERDREELRINEPLVGLPSAGIRTRAIRLARVAT